MTDTLAQSHSRFIRRKLLLLTQLSQTIEWELLSALPEPRIKKLKDYKRRVDWIITDVKTDPRMSGYAAALITDELNSEKSRDLDLCIDFLLQFENVGDILQVLKDSFEGSVKDLVFGG